MVRYLTPTRASPSAKARSTITFDQSHSPFRKLTEDILTLRTPELQFSGTQGTTLPRMLSTMKVPDASSICAANDVLESATPCDGGNTLLYLHSCECQMHETLDVGRQVQNDSPHGALRWLKSHNPRARTPSIHFGTSTPAAATS